MGPGVGEEEGEQGRLERIDDGRMVRSRDLVEVFSAYETPLYLDGQDGIETGPVRWCR